MRKTKIYGHRGSKGSFPENTLLSFEQAIKQGVDGLEIDVHLTKDGEVVVIHDEFLDRTTNGSGLIKEYDLKEIKKLSAGSKFTELELYEPHWQQETVPTLQEVFQLLAPYNIDLNIELKTYLVNYEEIEEKVLAIVNQFGNSRKVIYSSFHLPSLIKLKQLDASANIAWLLNQPDTHLKEYMDGLNFESLHINKDIVLSDRSHWTHLSSHIRVWTANSREEIQQLLEMSVNSIITDYPERALSLRNERKTVL
ncbi:glycerophosphodiester phosphodiesterase [Aquibacillus rhizosphaerae]|uniref:Glycerophosphodiester phosphodiesterase n=1 Tax=Aquibacillus rhizosphaerae TaxID=3051431 RepID=A0ABT7L7Q1_9BACI|nr:glycerophosphodiester phosphodiesterase [Aquibacillus sp. LR5S19]MDL4841886.1 glycerophosphodiester phosphodiesterase [Aquibacillus sp. LR5S19]